MPRTSKKSVKSKDNGLEPITIVIVDCEGTVMVDVVSDVYTIEDIVENSIGTDEDYEVTVINTRYKPVVKAPKPKKQYTTIDC